MVSEVTFDRFKHFTRVGVGLPRGGSARFLIDTGIGITVINSAVRERCGLEETGETFRGRRMSGQEVAAPLLNLPPLTLGTHCFDGHVGAALDLGEEGEGREFDGVLGLGLLGHLPLTINPFDNTVLLGQLPPEIVESATGSHLPPPPRSTETAHPLPFAPTSACRTGPWSRSRWTQAQPSRFWTPASCPHVPSRAPRTAPASWKESTKPGTHSSAPSFPPGAVCLDQAPATALRQPTVMFQDLALNGLIGTEYLDRYIQTYNTRAGTITLRERAKS